MFPEVGKELRLNENQAMNEKLSQIFVAVTDVASFELASYIHLCPSSIAIGYHAIRLDLLPNTDH